MKKRLIVTAHDFGLSKSVNEGILYVFNHKNNILTELSLLVNAPGSEQAAHIAKNIKLSTSLCLNLTTFKPLSKKALTLVDKRGNFKKVDVKTWNFKAIGDFDEEEVAKEIDAQWDWFLENVGKKPTAILSRKNETGDPKILMPLVEKAKKEGVPVRTPVWMWKENYGAQSFVEQEKVKSSGSIYVYPAWKGRWGYDLVRDFDKFVEDYTKKDGVAELVILTGFVDEELFGLSEYNWERGRFISQVERGDICDKIKSTFDLISYKDL